MKKIIVIVMLVVVGNVWAQEEGAQEVKIPKELQLIQTEYQNAVNSVTTPIRKKAVGKLEALKKKYGASGEIDNAVLVDNVIKEMTGKGEITENTEDIDGIGLPTNGKEDIKDIVGVWLVRNKDKFTFYSDGTWITNYPNLGGTWKKINKDTVKLISSSGNDQTFNISTKPGSIWSWNNGGDKGPAIKTKEKAKK